MSAEAVQTVSYQDILFLIEKGLYEEASLCLRRFREQPTKNNQEETTLLALLLSARIALKAGHAVEHIKYLDERVVSSPLLKAEICVVKGLVYFQKGSLQEAVDYFYLATKNYQEAGVEERAVLLEYNYLIALSHLRGVSSVDGLGLLDTFQDLQVRAAKSNNLKMMGLIHRQKSYLFKEAGRLNAALFEIQQGLPLLELHSARSDYHLGLLSAAEIAFDLGDHFKAEAYLEMVVGAIDKRVEFPLRYVQSLVHGTPLEEPSLQDACPHFVQRYEWRRQRVGGDIRQKVEVGVLELPSGDAEGNFILRTNEQLMIKKGGLEEMLLLLLEQGPQSKNLLCERLWPEVSDPEHLDNRLHRLISRLNKKIPGLIIYKKRRYSLSSK